MITKIVEALKAGSNSAVSVIAFGSNKKPNPPYVVVKQESDALGRGTAYRIIAHFKPGQQIFLEDYIKYTVGTILNDFSDEDRNGNQNELDFDEFGELPVLVENNDDGTISMDRVYWMPSKFFK